MSSEETSVIQDDRKVTFGYTRKRNLGNYESEEYSVYVTDHVPESEDNVAKFVHDKSEPMFDELRQQVWAALDLTFSFDDEGHPRLDTPPVAPPRPTNTDAPPSVVPPQSPPQSTRARRDGPAVAQIGMYADEPQFCKDCGERDFYDNRSDVDEKIRQRQRIGPDFKCKKCGGGNGKGKPVFRPGSYDYNQAVSSQPASMSPPE